MDMMNRVQRVRRKVARSQTLTLNHEINSCTNTNWQKCKDGNKLWDRIDWKGKSVVYQPKDISPSVTSKQSFSQKS